MIIKILASLVTGIGGHYLNRRWDKAILFLCLFILYLIGVYAYFIHSLQNITSVPDEMVQEVSNIYQLISKISAIGILILWLISLFVSIKDSKSNVTPTITEWTKYGIFGAIITSILSFALLAFAATNYFSSPGTQIADPDSIEYESDSYSPFSYNFLEYLYLGGSPANAHKLPPPPSGKGTLKGKISYHDNPAVGVTLDVVLNSKYRAKGVVTDSDGIFTVSLPPGTWTINSIQTESWKNKPEKGEFSLFYGGEKKLSGGNYNRHGNFEKTGYPTDITIDSDIIHFQATINEDIQLRWPDPKKEGIKATIDDTIQWEEYPGADRYYIEIKKIRREGSTTYYDQVTSKVLQNETMLPLIDLKYIKTNRKEDTEYAADIFAFSEDGTLIAQFSDTYQGGTFLISDGNILIEESMNEFLDIASTENPEEFEKKMKAVSLNQRRGRAVSVLIEDNMLGEAESLMNLMDSGYSQGKKEVLAGYIEALKGNCIKSSEMFDKAVSINPEVCIPEEYKQNCN